MSSNRLSKAEADQEHGFVCECGSEVDQIWIFRRLYILVFGILLRR